MRSLALVCVFASVAVGEPQKLVVWPRDPAITPADLAAADAAVREAGYEPIAFDPAIGDRLREAGVRAAADETRALDTVQAAFESARAAYLRQDYAAMADVLAGAEATALPVLAQPRHAAVLWELEFQRGLAALSKGESPRPRFDLALALDAARTPKRELYGPAVERAFTEAIDAHATVPPRPVAIRVTPRDARVVIDGLPLADNTAPRALRPGLHVVLASAPGFVTRAMLVELVAGQRIELALAPATGGAIDRIGAAWASGMLDPAGESNRRTILDVATDAGARGALVIAIDRNSRETAVHLLLADTARQERRPTVPAAIRAVLSPEAITAPPPRREHATVWRSPWLWAAVGVVAVAGTGVLLYTMRGEDTVRILPPE